MASTQLNISQPTTVMEATEGTARKPSSPDNIKWHESSQNAIVSSNGFATDFINHSMYNARAQAQAAQVHPNAQVQMGCPPFVEGGGGGGGGAHNPWPNHQQGTVFAGHYGSPQLQPMPQPLLPAMMGPLGLGHSNSKGLSIVDTITVKLRPGGDALTPPPVLQRALSDPSQLRLNQQPARSPSPSPPHPHPPYGENIPLLINVHKLRYDKRLKALIDKKDLMLNYNYTDNQMSSPAITPNQSPPPPGAGQGGEDGREEEDFPASPKKDLFVFHLPNGMTEGQLSDLFSQFGKLRRARIQFYIEEGKRATKGYGFVTFKRFSDAVVAVHSLNGFSVSHSKNIF
eukprot:scaffold24319_cov139-Skeletonema_dohrnii-CCMP3373.AAC.3